MAYDTIKLLLGVNTFINNPTLDVCINKFYKENECEIFKYTLSL